MASPFETEGSSLTQEQAEACFFNEGHVFRTKHVKTSKFWLRFNLVDMLKNLSELTWEKDSEDVVLLEEQWKESHFYLYVFKVDEQIGFDPEDFPPNHIAIYYSEKVPGEKWKIITAYPFTWAYYSQFLSRKNKFY